MECKLLGKLMEYKRTIKNNKPYLVIYSEGKLYNVFQNENDTKNYAEFLGKDIEITVMVYDPKFIRTTY